jgi:hypothetical protein
MRVLDIRVYHIHICLRRHQLTTTGVLTRVGYRAPIRLTKSE